MSNNMGFFKKITGTFSLCIFCIIFPLLFLSCTKDRSDTNQYQRPQGHLMDLNVTASFNERSDFDTNDDWSFPYIMEGGGEGNGTISNSSISMNMEFLQTIRKDGLLYSKWNMAETSNVGNGLVFENNNINFSSLPYLNGITNFEGILIVSGGSGKYAFQRGHEFKISGTINRNTHKLQMRLIGNLYF